MVTVNEFVVYAADMYIVCVHLTVTPCEFVCTFSGHCPAGLCEDLTVIPIYGHFYSDYFL